LNQTSTLLCPDCSGDMMGCQYPEQDSPLVWMCRCCGSSFLLDEKYELQPYLLEIYYPVCPGCGNSMVTAQESAAGGSTRWICKVCGEEINI
jgi:transcription elongation factor Elf1